MFNEYCFKCGLKCQTIHVCEIGCFFCSKCFNDYENALEKIREEFLNPNKIFIPLP
jgi:hypothetical protein